MLNSQSVKSSGEAKNDGSCDKGSGHDHARWRAELRDQLRVLPSSGTLFIPPVRVAVQVTEPRAKIFCAVFIIIMFLLELWPFIKYALSVPKLEDLIEIFETVTPQRLGNKFSLSS
jgi:hypothetical protein